MERKLQTHEGEKLQLHIPAAPTGGDQVLQEFPPGGHRLIIRKGVQPVHGVHRETQAMGRGHRLHRRAGGHRAGGRPGVLEDKFPEVVRRDAGRSFERRYREPPGHHPVLRTGKGEEHMDTQAAAARMEGVLPERHGGPGKQGPPDTAQHASHHQYGRV